MQAVVIVMNGDTLAGNRRRKVGKQHLRWLKNSIKTVKTVKKTKEVYTYTKNNAKQNKGIVLYCIVSYCIVIYCIFIQFLLLDKG